MLVQVLQPDPTWFVALYGGKVLIKLFLASFTIFAAMAIGLSQRSRDLDRHNRDVVWFFLHLSLVIAVIVQNCCGNQYERDEQSVTRRFHYRFVAAAF